MIFVAVLKWVMYNFGLSLCYIAVFVVSILIFNFHPIPALVNINFTTMILNNKRTKLSG